MMAFRKHLFRAIAVPQRITGEVAQLSPETMAECAAAKARLANAAREAERIEEAFTEGRIHRDGASNPHDA